MLPGGSVTYLMGCGRQGEGEKAFEQFQFLALSHCINNPYTSNALLANGKVVEWLFSLKTAGVIIC